MTTHRLAAPHLVIPDRTLLIGGKPAVVKALVDDSTQVLLYYINLRSYETMSMEALMLLKPLLADE